MPYSVFYPALAVASAAIWWLSGCSATAPVNTVEVRVPRATFRADSELASLDDYRLVLALAKDRLERQAHIARLEAILQGCIK